MNKVISRFSCWYFTDLSRADLSECERSEDKHWQNCNWASPQKKWLSKGGNVICYKSCKMRTFQDKTFSNKTWQVKIVDLRVEESIMSRSLPANAPLFALDTHLLICGLSSPWLFVQRFSEVDKCPNATPIPENVLTHMNTQICTATALQNSHQRSPQPVLQHGRERPNWINLEGRPVQRNGANTGVWPFQAPCVWFQVWPKMARHPLKMLLGALLSAWPFQVGFGMARHLCVLVSGSGHSVTCELKWGGMRLWAGTPQPDLPDPWQSITAFKPCQTRDVSAFVNINKVTHNLFINNLLCCP